MLSKMKFSYLFLFLILSICFSDKYGDIERYIQMILENLQAIADYVSPVNNKKIVHITDQTIYDYGTFDFIIVGTGAAGAILANRLSEIQKWNILLLEAGEEQTEFSYIPGLSYYLSKSEMNWGYNTTPQINNCQGMINNSCSAPRGKVIGGSTTINAKMYARGNKEDFNQWVQMGNPSWSYEEVLPYFMKSENCHIANVDVGYHGNNGELDISSVEKTIFSDVFLQAGPEIRLNVSTDYNGKDQMGVSTIQYFIKGNRSVTSGSAFLDPIRNRKNLNISIKSYVTKVLIEKTSKLTYGVGFIKDGKQYIATASKEVLIAAGAFNTPQLLMLSGIGPAEELKKFDIEPLVDLPVGKNMQDHPLFLGLVIHTNQTLFNESLEIAVKTYFGNHRPLTSPYSAENTAFINVSDPMNDVPNIQFIQTVPWGFDMSDSGALNFRDEIRLQYCNKYNRYSDIINFIILLHPKSKGSVTLKSNKPIDFPNIDYNFFTDSNNEDIEILYQGIVTAIKLIETDAYKAVNASIVNVAEYCGANNDASNREYWYCAIKYLTLTIFHPVGTSRMGTSTTDSVVSSDLFVHGIKNLRIIDASIMPEITSGNIAAPIFMFGEKMADVIKEFYNVTTCQLL